jgi:hypothetical protein
MTKSQSASAETSETKKAPPESPLARASRVANIVDLENVRFVQFSAHAHCSRDDLSTPELIHRAAFTRPRVSRNGSAIVVSSTFVLTVAKQSADVGQDTLASLRATVELMYRTKGDETTIDDGDLSEFANVNVPFNSWGYWREFVQSSLGRLGFAANVTLPLFRVHTAKNWMIDDDGTPPSPRPTRPAANPT